MSKKDKLRTIARAYGRSGVATCYLCGESTEIRHAEIRLVDSDPPRGPWLTVCPSCADAGPAGAAERLRQRAEGAPVNERPELVRLADGVAKIAAEDWATTKDLNWAAIERERSYRVLQSNKIEGSRTEAVKWQRYRKSPSRSTS